MVKRPDIQVRSSRVPLRRKMIERMRLIWGTLKTVLTTAVLFCAEFLTSIFHFTVKLLAAVLASAILIVLLKAVFSGHTVDLRSIEVPKALSEAGLTSKVITWRLRDALNANRQRLISSVLPTNILVLQDLPSVDIPEAGVSIDHAVALVRSLLPSIWRHDEIYGEFTLLGKRLSLELRLNEKVVFTSSTLFSPVDNDVQEVKHLVSEAALVLTMQRYSGAIRQNPSFAPLRIALGYVWLDHNRIENAIDSFKEALSLDPSKPDAHVALGFIARSKGEWEEASHQFNLALKLDPKNADAYVGLGYTQGARNDLDEAIHAFNQVRRLNPNSVDARVGLGAIYLARNDPDRAVKEFQDAIRLHPEAPDPYISLGQARLAQHRLDDAIAAFQDGARLNSQSPEPHLGIGSARLDQNRPDEAMAEFREAIRLSRDAFSIACSILASKATGASSGTHYSGLQRRLEALLDGTKHCPTTLTR